MPTKPNAAWPVNPLASRLRARSPRPGSHWRAAPLRPSERARWWAASEAAAALQAVQRLRHVVLAATLSAREWSLAEQHATELLAADPFDELALRAQMTAMSRSGRNA